MFTQVNKEKRNFIRKINYKFKTNKFSLKFIIFHYFPYNFNSSQRLAQRALPNGSWSRTRGSSRGNRLKSNPIQTRRQRRSRLFGRFMSQLLQLSERRRTVLPEFHYADLQWI